MSGKLTVRSIVEGIVDGAIIDDNRSIAFLVTFETTAYEDGHVVWLSREFEVWKNKIEKTSGATVLDIAVNKASSKGNRGSIAVSMTAPGFILLHEAKCTAFVGNFVVAIRKTLAEVILRQFSPDFDFKNPLFDALHDYQYSFIPCSDWAAGKNERLVALEKNNLDLSQIVDDCGAILKEVRVAISSKDIATLVSLSLRWKQHATEEQRSTLEKVLVAYFRGVGFDASNWRVVSVK